jgi:hypothetical protein
MQKKVAYDPDVGSRKRPYAHQPPPVSRVDLGRGFVPRFSTIVGGIDNPAIVRDAAK